MATPGTVDPPLSPLQLDCREITAQMTRAQVTAPLIGGHRVGITVRLGAGHTDDLQIRGAITGVTCNTAQEIFALEVGDGATVHDVRLRQLMLDLLAQHAASDDDTVRATLADVLRRLEKIQPVGQTAAPEQRHTL